jgi:hypothetical protein
LRTTAALRVSCVSLTIVILTAQIPALMAVMQTTDWNGYGATDYEIYMAATRRWLAGDSFYVPDQLSGPYSLALGHVLYPPIALWLFVPFTFLPAVLWWVIPLGVTTRMVWRLRPGPLAWPLMALSFWQPVQIHLISGNPGIWMVMFLALALVYPGVAPFVLMKSSLGLFGLWGIRHRAWWYGFAVFCSMSIILLPLWFDWLCALLNQRGSGGLLYSWQEAPLMLVPLLAWLTRPGGRYDVERRASVDRMEHSLEMTRDRRKPVGGCL